VNGIDLLASEYSRVIRMDGKKTQCLQNTDSIGTAL
jgi:hypothetical protein